MLFRSFLQTAPLHLGKILQGQNQKHDLKLMAASIHPITVEPDMQLSWGIGCILMHKPSGIWWTGSQPRGTYDIGSSSPSCTVHSVYICLQWQRMQDIARWYKWIQMDSRLLKLFVHFVHFVLILIIIRPPRESICPYFFCRSRKWKSGSWQTKTHQNIPNQSQF